MENEHTIIVRLILFLSVVVLIQICAVEYEMNTDPILYRLHLGPSNPPLYREEDIGTRIEELGVEIEEKVEEKIKVEEKANVEEKVNNEVQVDSLRSFEEILTRAGVEVNDEIRDQLPPKEDVVGMYGSEPVIIGLDQCETFVNTVVKGDGFIAPAGMFNTGTNLLEKLLSYNCYLPDRLTKHRNKGMRWQVPWGKHSPVQWRNKHKAPKMEALNQTAFLPAVVIKDPYTWMDSMCRHSYAANWPHFENHCPNLVPITPEEKKKLKNDETFKVNIRYRATNITHHDSLADLWNTWYGDWLDADFPRLIVRFEDLLLHAEKVVGQICECGGGKLNSDKPGVEFKYSVDSAKKGTAHKGSNGLVKSITKYSDKNNRLKSFSTQDLTYAVKAVRNDIMDMFGYAIPQVKDNNIQQSQ